MKHLTTLKIVILASAALGLGACGKASSGLFAEHSIPLIAPAASAETAPRFIGKWAASTEQCATPMVIDVRGLRAAGADCDFSGIDTSSAGYAVGSTCKVAGGLSPGRIYIMMSDPEHATAMTLSGGPFADPVALQRCPAA